VALILDALALAERAHVLGEAARPPAAAPARASAGADQQQQCDLLVFTLGAEVRMAMPLALVTRLEEIPRAAIERVAGRSVVQYRGRILPLVPLAEVFGVGSAETDPLSVVVHADGERCVGLVVERILDVARASLRPTAGPVRPGTAGAVVIGERVTELLDLPAVLAREAA
jgi:two-component system chemotaxis sensor kinase CheA